MSKANPRYKLIVFYVGELDEGKDRAIEKAAKRKRHGSVYDQEIRERSLSFRFSHKRTAETASKRIKAIKGVVIEGLDEKAEKYISV